MYQNNPLLNADKKLKDFTAEEWKILKYGVEDSLKIEIKSNNTGRVDKVDYEGVIPRFYRVYVKRDIKSLKQSLQDEIMSHVTTAPCQFCGGTGLNPEALESRILGKNIVDCMSMSASELLSFCETIDTHRGISISRQICDYLQRMVAVGIGYLSLDRKTESLSGGEAQRLKMVRNLGSSLNNITYIFDEPTSGLHPADAEKIGDLLWGLRDKENNVLVVEHNRQILNLADHVIELGPEAGCNGGYIVFDGARELLFESDTATAPMQRKQIEVNTSPLEWSEGFEIKNAHLNNLKHVEVVIPKGILTAVTGVAGSGKSTLMRYEFVARYPEAIVVGQKPIGTSIRSTPATYTGVMDEIRKVFAKENHVTPSWLSFNSKGGCPICKGTGQITYDMAFADAVTVECEECGGHRYNPTALSYLYKGKTIEDVLNLTTQEAIEFFEQPKIKYLLSGLLDVGLGYLTLGQPTSTLSGGEIQRIKLASELQKKGQIYIIDEPTTGLHYKDVMQLLSLLRQLVNAGNTVVIIEHRLELIAQADWIIDIGPEGGINGGNILFTGTPSALLECEGSKTSFYLKQFMAEG